MTLLVRPEARHDIGDAAEWYEKRQDGIGKQFVAAVDKAIGKIEAKPALYSQRYRDLRRVLVERFPYAVYYREIGNDVVVYAVLHQRQDFKVLDDRLQQ